MGSDLAAAAAPQQPSEPPLELSSLPSHQPTEGNESLGIHVKTPPAAADLYYPGEEPHRPKPEYLLPGVTVFLTLLQLLALLAVFIYFAITGQEHPTNPSGGPDDEQNSNQSQDQEEMRHMHHHHHHHHHHHPLKQMLVDFVLWYISPSLAGHLASRVFSLETYEPFSSWVPFSGHSNLIKGTCIRTVASASPYCKKRGTLVFYTKNAYRQRHRNYIVR